jgi:uridine kinase
MRRPEVVGELAGILVGRVRPDGVLRVAVTGITACGKSTLATELRAAVAALGTPCIRLAVDGFHNPRAIRYRRGRDSAEGYYRDAYDYARLTERVLLPLGPGGSLRYAPRAFDLDTDTPVDVALEAAPAGGVAVLDASFLLRPEIRDFFDYRIFVAAAFETAEARGVARDAGALGGPQEAERLYRTRYHEAWRIHFREARPLQHADAIVVNDDLDDPALFVRRP